MHYPEVTGSSPALVNFSLFIQIYPITNLTTIGFSLTNSIISSTILQEIKRKQQAHVFVLIHRGKEFANYSQIVDYAARLIV